MFWKKRAQFWTDSIALTYASPEAAIRWWTHLFGAKQVEPAADRDYALPSDVWLTLGFDDLPAVCFSKLDEVRGIGLECIGDSHPIVTCNDIELARKHCLDNGASPTAIREDAGPRHFEITDPEGNVIEICEDM
jgi:catechol 2,3-dioxygenase-like lactoylglutathione lyase family enzyme